MRYAAGQKEETRKKMVQTAARVLRRDGIAAAGVASLMAEAGLTNGAFYAHFESKEALVAEAVVAALTETTAAIAARIEQAPPGKALDAVIDHYLDPRHVDHPEHGCAVAALAPELARRPAATRVAVDKAVAALIDTIAGALPPGQRNAQDVARAVFASLVGTIQLARTTSLPLVPRILAAGAVAARTIAQAPAGTGRAHA
ncbi:TetR family transcriptional regulator [Pseudoduganella flava]|nr:TetR/AcrR family transcriptional regulator [Pseudoduganella flava]TWI50210.1 TetR family transcriptional regulator [Pseudoduganella flava]